MQRERLKSKAVISAGYDASARELELEFRSGHVYRYENVAWDLNQDLSTASEVSQTIRDRTAKGQLGMKTGGGIYDYTPDGTQLPPNRDVIQAAQSWDGKGCLVVHMAPQPAGRVLNGSDQTLHGIRIEMKT